MPPDSPRNRDALHTRIKAYHICSTLHLKGSTFSEKEPPPKILGMGLIYQCKNACYMNAFNKTLLISISHQESLVACPNADRLAASNGLTSLAIFYSKTLLLK